MNTKPVSPNSTQRRIMKWLQGPQQSNTQDPQQLSKAQEAKEIRDFKMAVMDKMQSLYTVFIHSAERFSIALFADKKAGANGEVQINVAEADLKAKPAEASVDPKDLGNYTSLSQMMDRTV